MDFGAGKSAMDARVKGTPHTIHFFYLKDLNNSQFTCSTVVFFIRKSNVIMKQFSIFMKMSDKILNLFVFYVYYKAITVKAESHYY